MFSPSQILVTDIYSQPNCGHTDVSWATCITRIFALKANLKLKKTSAAFFKPFSMLRRVQSLIYQIFSDNGWVPLNAVRTLANTSYFVIFSNMNTTLQDRSWAFVTSPDFRLTYFFLRCRGTGHILARKQFLNVNIHVLVGN